MACNICCWAGPFYPFVGVLLRLLIAAPLIAAPLMAAPLMAAPLMAAPLMAAPLMAAPLMAAPLMAAPLMAGSSHKDGMRQEGYSISMLNTLLFAVFPR
jgi:hypothetical protein